MMEKLIAISVIVLHILTVAMSPSFAGDGWVAMDSQGNVVSQADGNQTNVNVAANQSYKLLNADISPEQTVNINILNNGIADPSAKAIFNIGDNKVSVWEGVLNVAGTAAFINSLGFDVAQSFQGNVQGGVILSSLGISQAVFFQGMAELSREISKNPALVSNKGNFNLAENSFLALIGSAVRNQGNVAANGGAVVLAAGDKVTMDLGRGDGLISVTIDKSVDTPVYDFAGNKISDAVSNSGKIKTDGGIAILSAKAAEGIFDHVVNHTGILEADSIREVNGRILLDGGEQGIVQVAGDLNARGDDAGEKGGRVEVLGEKVALYGETRADVSGQAGGGTLLIGGDYQGLGSARNASYIYVDPNASLKADALLEGDGGKIIVWGDKGTRAYGALSARGGVLGGNGGLIETSGKAFLDVTSIRVDASASNGKAGLWYLDPENTDVDNFPTAGGSFNGLNPNVFTPTADSAMVNIADIQFSLNNGTDVTITTVGSGGTQLGDVRVKNKIEKTAGGNAIFKILSAHDIELEIPASIVSTAGALGIFFEAANQIILRNFITTNGGSVTLNAAHGIRLAEAEADIKTAGGAFTANADTANTGVYSGSTDGTFFTNGASAISGGAGIDTAAGQVDIRGRRVEMGGALKSTTGNLKVTAERGFITIDNLIQTGGGNVVLNAKDGIDLNSEFADIRTSGGSVTANANTDLDALGEFNQNDAGDVINSSAGKISLSGRQVGIVGTLRSTTGDIELTAAQGAIGLHNSILTTGGNVKLLATNGITLDNVNSDITTAGGKLTAGADSDASGNGTFNQSNTGSVINTAAGDQDIAGHIVTTAGTLRSTSGNIKLTSTGGPVTVSNTITTTGGNVTINGANGINLDNANSDVTTAGGLFTANADADANHTGDFLQSNAGSVVNTAGGKLSVSGDLVNLDGSLRSGLGDMTLTSTGAYVSVAGMLETTGGKIDINGANGINLDGPTDIRTTGGAFTANADSDASGSGTFAQSNSLSVVNTAGGKLSVSGDKVDLDGTLRSGAGEMVIASTGGFVSVSKTLETQGSKLTINGANGINLDGPTDIRTTGGEFSGNADSDLNNTGDFVQSDVLSVVNTAGGKLTAAGNKINLDGTFRSGLGNMLLTSTGGLLSIAGTLEALGGNITVNSANGISLDGPTDIRTTGGKFEANADADGNHTGMFDQINAGSVVSTTGGSLTVSGDKINSDGTFRSGLGNMLLTSTGGLLSVAGTLETLGGSMTLNSANGISLDGPTDIRTTGGKFEANADADANFTGEFLQSDILSTVNSGAGKLSISAQRMDLDGILKTTTSDVDLLATGGFINVHTIQTQGGHIDMKATNGVSVDGPGLIETQGGFFNADANTDNNGSGAFTQTDALSVITTSSGALTGSGVSVDLQGTLKSGGANIAITATRTSVSLGKEIETQGGNLDILAPDGITLNGTDVRTEGGYFNANANVDNNNSGIFTHTGILSNLLTSGGSIDAVGISASFEGTLKSGGADIAITATRGTVSLGKEVETQGGDIDLLAPDGITLNGTAVRTEGGYFHANADTDLDNPGDFNQTGAASLINTLGGELTITARGIGLEGVLRSGLSNILLTASAGALTASGDLLTDGGFIHMNAADGITLTDMQLRTLGGEFQANANTDGDDPGTFTQTGITSILTTQSLTALGGDMTISARKVDIKGSVVAGDGDITIEGTQSTVTLGNEVTTLGGKVDIKAAEGFTLDGADADIRSNGGNISINANTDMDEDGSYKETNGGSLVDTGGGSFTITANDFGMNGTHQAVGNTVSLLTNKPGIPIHLGFSTHTNNEANIKDGESDRIFADTLLIGASNAGNILAGDYSPANVTNLILQTGGQVIEDGASDAAADIVAPNLAIHSVSGVNVDVDVTNLAIQNDGSGGINVEDMAGGMTVGSVGGFSGVSTAGGGITLITHSPLTINTAVTDTLGGDITLTADGATPADILTLAADVSTAGKVALNAGGAISQTAGSVSAGTLEFNAGGSAALAQSGNDAGTAAGTANGTLTLTDKNALTIGAVGTHNGLVSGGNLIDVKSAGDLTISQPVNADAGDVHLESTGGAMNGDGAVDDNIADVIGSTVNLKAGAGGIGTTAKFDVTASTALNADTTADGSGILIDSVGNALLGLINAKGSSNIGDVTLNSTGAIDSVSHDTAADVTGKNIALVALAGGIGAISPVDISVTGVVTASAADGSGIVMNGVSGDFKAGLINGGAGLINLTSAGAFIDGNGVLNNFIAGPLALLAAAGIGSADALETTVSSVDLKNTTAGNIAVDQLASGGNLNVDRAQQQGSGDVTIRTLDGSLNVTAGKPGVSATSGTILLEAQDAGASASDDLTINSSVTSTSGKIQLKSDARDVTFGPQGNVISISGSVEVTGARDITMTDGQAVNAGSGKIKFETGRNIGLSSVKTTSNASDAVILKATNGEITDGGDADPEIVTGLASGTATLIAGTGIGNLNPLETVVRNLSAVTNTGSVRIHNTGALDLVSANGVTGVSILDTANLNPGGQIEVTAASPLTVDSAVTNNAGGDITLASLGANAADDLTLHANVGTNGGNGNIQLVAGDTFTIDSGVTVSAVKKGNITVAAGENFSDGLFNQNGNTEISGGDVVMGATSEIKTDDGNITVDSAHDIFLAALNANANNDKVRGDVKTYSRTGKTIDVNGKGVNITAGNLTMLSSGDIGSKSDPIELAANTQINKPKITSFPQCVGLAKCSSNRYTVKLKK